MKTSFDIYETYMFPSFSPHYLGDSLLCAVNCMCHTQRVVFKVILHTQCHIVFKRVEVILILNMAAKLLASAVLCRMCLHTNVLMCLCMPLSLNLTLHQQRGITVGGVGSEFQRCLLKRVNQADYCVHSPPCNTLLPLSAALNPMTENYLTLVLCLCALGRIHDSRREPFPF